MTKVLNFDFVTPIQRSLVRRLGNLVLDLVIGLGTSSDIGYDRLRFATSQDLVYRSTDWFTLLIVWRMLNSLDISKDDVFMDVGSGKGRMLFLASHYPFKRVIGVEVSRALNEVARMNLINRSKSRAIRKIKLFQCDALTYVVPDDVSVVYFNNPFQGQVFLKVIDNVQASLRRHPRRLEIIYAFPVMHQALLARGFHVVKRGAWPSLGTVAPRTVLMYSNTAGQR